jgi:hypothetical protein
VAKTKSNTEVKTNWEDVIKASVKNNPKPKPKKKSAKKK